MNQRRIDQSTHHVRTRPRCSWPGTRATPDALEALLPLVYEELRRLAAHYMKGERTGHTLQATALVNEAYLRLIEVRQVQWQNRAHFFAMAARLMRRILVDAARSRGYQKRGGGAPMVSLDEALVVPTEPGERSGGAGRRADGARGGRSAEESGGGDAILRRAQPRRDRRSAARLARHGQARLENGEAVAAAGVTRRQADDD